MKNCIINITTLLLILLTTRLFAQNNIKFIPENPSPGETIEISYKAASTNLKDKKSISAVAYLFRNYKWEPLDLNCKAEGNNMWRTSVTAPKDCGIICFKFFAGDTVDNNNEQSYCIMLREADGTQSTGACAGWGLLRSPSYNFSIPEYLNNHGISDTATYYWLQKEIALHPTESKSILAVPFAMAMSKANIENAATAIQRVLYYLMSKSNNTERDLIAAQLIASNVINNKTMADSLEKVILKRYPKGNLARLKDYRHISNQEDFSKFPGELERFLEDYPVENADKAFDLDNNIDYDRLYIKVIIIGIITNKNYSFYNQYLDKLSFNGLVNLYHKMIEVPHNRKDITDEQLFNYDTTLVKRIEQIRDQKPSGYWYKSTLEWRQLYNESFVKYILPIHINILKNTGMYDEALDYAEFAESIVRYKQAALNNDYAFLLQKKGADAKLQNVLLRSMYENQATPEMITMIKNGYLKQYKTDQGFDAYLNSLKNATNSIESKSAIEKQLINKPLPDWSMYDMDGKLVKLKDLRGKIVILDFWATWCVPCKASFPGMKIAVEKYKSDKDVVFYFVDTEEFDPNYKIQVKKYMKENIYPFNVLFDNKADGQKTNNEVYKRLCNYLKSTGIPFKIFIDKNGSARLATTGNSFSATELADDVLNIIDAIKNKK